MRNQIIYQTCTVNFNYNETDCRRLDDKDASSEIHVSLQTINIRNYLNIILDF